MSSTNTNKKYIRRRRGACDSCKQRKVRCDGENPCAACHRSSTNCRYQQPTARPRHSVLASIDTEISQSRRPPSLLLNTTLNSTWDRGSEFLCFSPDDSGWSSVPWRGDFASNLIFSPDIECFERVNIDADCAWQSVWSYPGDQAKQDQGQQYFGFQSPLPEPTGFDAYIPKEMAQQQTSSLLTPSPERSLHNPLLYSTDGPEDFDQFNTIYNPPATFSSKTLFSDLRFTNLGEIGDISGLLDEIQRHYCMLKRPQSLITPIYVKFDSQVKQYIDACYDEPFCVSLFFSKDYLRLVAEQVLDKKNASDYYVILLYAVLAIGCYILKVERDGDVKQGLAEAYSLFQVAEDCQNSTAGRGICKESFLATLVMLLFARKCSRECENRLLATLSNISIGLQLHRISSIDKLCDNETSKMELRRAFWLYYSIEKPHSLRLGSYSMIDDILLDHQPPSSELKYEDSCSASVNNYPSRFKYESALQLQCRFAKICDLIITKLYTPHGLQKSPPELFNSIFQLGGILKHWKDSIPEDNRPLDLTSASTFVPELCKASQEQLSLSYQYYEALWSIHGRWRLCNPLQMTEEDMMHMTTSREVCVNVAKMVLNTSSEFRIVTLLSHWSISQLPLIASLVMFLDAIDPEISGSKENMLPYLSIAEGFYGRLSTLENASYKIVLSMTSVLRQILIR